VILEEEGQKHFLRLVRKGQSRHFATAALAAGGLSTAAPVLRSPRLAIVSKATLRQAPLQPAPRSNSSLKVPVTKMGQARADRRRHRANFEAGGTTRRRDPRYDRPALRLKIINVYFFRGVFENKFRI
jgi:hypothetical protein